MLYFNFVVMEAFEWRLCGRAVCNTRYPRDSSKAMCMIVKWINRFGHTFRYSSFTYPWNNI